MAVLEPMESTLLPTVEEEVEAVPDPQEVVALAELPFPGPLVQLGQEVEEQEAQEASMFYPDRMLEEQEQRLAVVAEDATTFPQQTWQEVQEATER